jgi:amino acid permease
MIFVTCLVISIFDISEIAERDGIKPKSGYDAINDETYFDMIGFSFFMFEGIGAVMPVMNACSPEVHQNFPYILVAALGTLCTVYIIFSEINYYTFGNGLNQPIVMGMMPADDPIIQIVKVLFSLNIMFSYPITIYPTNQILDEMLLSRFPNNSTYRVLFFRLICTIVLILGLVSAI